jgi:hypothetical protein
MDHKVISKQEWLAARRDLEHRDVAMVAVSRAPLPKLNEFKKRMGWSFKWASLSGSDFNSDYHVSFSRKTSKRSRFTITTRFSHFRRLRDRGSPSSIMMKPVLSSTLIRHSLEAWICLSRPITCWISFQRAATNLDSAMGWSGCGTTTDTTIGAL